MINRIVTTDRFISIDLEKGTSPITGEYGDSSDTRKKYDGNLSPSNILNQQSNA